MIADGPGLRLLNLPEDFYSKVAVENSCGDLLFFLEKFWRYNCLQVIGTQHFPQSAFPEQKIMVFVF